MKLNKQVFGKQIYNLKQNVIDNMNQIINFATYIME